MRERGQEQVPGQVSGHGSGAKPRVTRVSALNAVVCLVGVAVACVTGSALADDGGTILKKAPPQAGVQSMSYLDRMWNFDSQSAGDVPNGFTAGSIGDEAGPQWLIEANPTALTAPNRLVQGQPCRTPECLRVLLAQEPIYEWPDLAVRFQTAGEGSQAKAGIIFAAKDKRNFYAVLVDVTAKAIDVLRIHDGQSQVIVHEPIKKSKPGPWHLLRVQHNTILSKDFMEIAYDTTMVVSAWDDGIGAGLIGLVTAGDTPIAFDNFRAIQLITQRPMSPPAAYSTPVQR